MSVFLGGYELLCLQESCHFLYDVAIGRTQLRISKSKPVFISRSYYDQNHRPAVNNIVCEVFGGNDKVTCVSESDAELDFANSVLLGTDRLLIWRKNNRVNQKKPDATIEEMDCWLEIKMSDLPDLKFVHRAKPLVYRNFTPPTLVTYKQKFVVASGGY